MSSVTLSAWTLDSPDPKARPSGVRLERVASRVCRLAIAAAITLALTIAPLGFPQHLAEAQTPGGLPPDVVVYHILGPFESIADVANAYGIAAADLVAANSLRDTQSLRVGQYLRVPLASRSPTPAESSKYVVQAGDTLGRIAARFGATVEVLASLNGIADPSLIREGQTLSIPGSPTAAKVTVHPFRTLTITPSPARQGQTIEIAADLEDGRVVVASLDGEPLAIVLDGALAWCIVPVAPWAPLGDRALVITAQAPGASGVRLSCRVPVVSGDFPIDILEIPADRLPLLDPAVSAAESVKFVQIFGTVTARKLWAGRFVQPAQGEITSAFASRRSYNGEDPDSYHNGVDLGAAEGAPVVAGNSGRVVFAETTRVRGNVVVIDHGMRLLTAYYHLSRIDVQPGQMVATGDQIGLVGNTGLSTGAHLHWEMRLAGVPVSALQWTTQTIP